MTKDRHITTGQQIPPRIGRRNRSQAPKGAMKDVMTPKDTHATPDTTNGTSNGAPSGVLSEAPPKVATKEARKVVVPPKEAPKAEAAKEIAPVPEENPPREGLRLRMKIWSDPTTHKRYLMPSAVMPDPRFGTMHAYAMSDEDTKIVKMTPAEWNALPFFYFQEDGPAPRASARPVDKIP